MVSVLPRIKIGVLDVMGTAIRRSVRDPGGQWEMTGAAGDYGVEVIERRVHIFGAHAIDAADMGRGKGIDALRELASQISDSGLKDIPVCLEISNRSSTTGCSSGIPSLLRISSASLSGSPGISGPLVPGAGLVLRKT